MNEIVAEKFYKILGPRVEENFELNEVLIKDLLKTLKESKMSKSRGNDNLNMYVIRQIPEFSAICIRHIIDCIIRTSIFPQE